MMSRHATDGRVPTAMGTPDLPGTGYEFREDYVSHWIPIWEQHFGGLRGQPGLRILEIGSFEGRSAVWFLENLLTADDASIVCLDPFYADGTEELFDANIERTGSAAKVTKRKQRSDEYLASLPDDAFDLIYIDGGHDAQTVLFDAIFSWPLLKRGGLVLFDDYEWEPQRPAHDRPQISIDVFMAIVSGEFELLHEGYQLIGRKTFGS